MKLAIVFTLGFTIAAFARQQPTPATSQPADPARQEQQATSPPAFGTKTTIYVYRLRLTAGMFNKPPIYVDEREIARITNGRFFIVNLDPGRHVIRSEHKTAVVTLDMHPGQIYYIRVAWEPTQYTARAATTLVPPEQAWPEIGQTESSNPSDIKDHELAVVGAMPPKPAPAPATAEKLSAPGSCRSIVVIRSVLNRINVLDVVNYPGAYVGKWFVIEDLPTVERDGVKIFLLTKGYTPEDLARAHSFCQSQAKEAEPKEMVEGTLADSVLQADIQKMIRAMEPDAHPNCEFQIVKQSHEAGTPGVERWEVKSCDAASSYDVRIVPSPQGGTDFRVTKSVLGQEKRAAATVPPPVSSQAEAADALPEGFVLYEGEKSQFTIAFPKGWVAQDQSQMSLGKGKSKFNLTLFYLPLNPTPEESKSVELMTKLMTKLANGIDTGEIPSFFVQKTPAKNGMSCAGLSEKADKDVFKMITGDPILGKGAAILEAPRSEPISVAGCKGIRIRGTGQPAKENAPETLDVYAASDGKVLYLFTLRSHADNYKKNAEIFEKSVATAKLTAAE
jgi:hypothetical protein